MQKGSKKSTKVEPEESKEQQFYQHDMNSLLVKILESSKSNSNEDTNKTRIKGINRYLRSTQDYRGLGLIALANFLELHTVVGLSFTTEKECQELEWIELLLKMIDQKQESVDKCYPILNKLLTITSNHPDIHKIIQNKFIQKIVDSIVDNSASVASFELLLTCLKEYSGTCGIYKNKINDFCISLVNSSNVDLVRLAGSALHSLQRTRGGSTGGSLYKKNWAELHEKVLNTIDAEFEVLLNQENRSKTGQSERLKLPEVTREGSKKDSTPLLYLNLERFIRFRNLCIFLEAGLLHPFPTPKTIQLERIITKLVDKGVNLNSTHLHKKDEDSMLTYVLHVEIQKCFLNILKSAILAAGDNILVHSKDICDVLWKCLKGTNIQYDELRVESNSSLRIAAYDVLVTFIRASPNNFFVYRLAENFMKEAFIDITPIQTEILLTLPSEQSKSSRKKKKNNEARKTEREKTIDNCLHLHQELCEKSLDFLRNLLTFNGAAMKSILLKILQDKILSLAYKFLSQELTANDLYHSTDCRASILELTNDLLVHPSIRNVTPMSFFIEILRKCRDHDVELKLRQRATEMLRNCESILHNRKNPIHFPADLKEFRDSWLFNEKTVKAFEAVAGDLRKIEISNGERPKLNGGSKNIEEEPMEVNEEEISEKEEEKLEVPKLKRSAEVDEKEVIKKSRKISEESNDDKQQSSDESEEENIAPTQATSKEEVPPVVEKINRKRKASDEKEIESKPRKNSENVVPTEEVDKVVDDLFADFACE